MVGWGGHLPGGGINAGVKEVLDTVRINTPEEVRLIGIGIGIGGTMAH